MIHYTNKNIFETNAKALVNPVNKVGVMGKGLALQFRNKYPLMFQEYKLHNWNISPIHIYKGYNITIINLPTKHHWVQPSSISLIEKGLKELIKYEWESLAIPMLGCGNGGLNWENLVKPLLIDYLKDIPSVIYICEGLYKN